MTLLLSLFLAFQCGGQTATGTLPMPKPPAEEFCEQFFRRNVQPNCPDGRCPYPPLNPMVVVEPAEPALPAEDLAKYEALIPAPHRIRNRNGNCVWCAVESVWVSAGYEQFNGITARAIQRGWSGATISNVTAALDAAKAPYKVERNGDPAIFAHAEKEGVGVYIQVPKFSNHALVCLSLNERRALILDNNGPPKIQTWSRAKFDRNWSGIACCPLFKRPKRPDVKPPDHPPVQPSADLSQLLKDAEEAKGRLTALESELAGMKAMQAQQGQALQAVSSNVNTLITVVEKIKSSGSSSLPGPAGPAGPQGPAGPSGSPADEARIKAVEEDVAALRKQLAQPIRVRVAPKGGNP